MQSVDQRVVENCRPKTFSFFKKNTENFSSVLFPFFEKKVCELAFDFLRHFSKRLKQAYHQILRTRTHREETSKQEKKRRQKILVKIKIHNVKTLVVPTKKNKHMISELTDTTLDSINEYT